MGDYCPSLVIYMGCEIVLIMKAVFNIDNWLINGVELASRKIEQ